ncbi:hypothetical protein IE53DRAFT_379040, partial [Violaceomyces palustris]
MPPKKVKAENLAVPCQKEEEEVEQEPESEDSTSGGGGGRVKTSGKGSSETTKTKTKHARSTYVPWHPSELRALAEVEYSVCIENLVKFKQHPGLSKRSNSKIHTKLKQ